MFSLPLAAQTFRRVLLLARGTDLQLHHAGRHTALATLADAPTSELRSRYPQPRP